MIIQRYMGLFSYIFHIPSNRRIFSISLLFCAISILESDSLFIKNLSGIFLMIVFLVLMPMEVHYFLKEKEIRMFDNLANPQSQVSKVQYTPGLCPRLTEREIENIAKKYPWVEIYEDPSITTHTVYKARRLEGPRKYASINA